MGKGILDEQHSQWLLKEGGSVFLRDKAPERLYKATSNSRRIVLPNLRPGQYPKNQAESSYTSRSQVSILNSRGPLSRSEDTYIHRAQAPNLGSNPLRPSRPSEVQLHSDRNPLLIQKL